MKLSTFIGLFVFWALRTSAQFSDSFTDGDFTNSPAWTTDAVSNWTVVNNQLRSNSSTANTSFYISTPSAQAQNTQWEFYVNLQFNTSSANFIDVYLTSSNQTMAASNGYFVRIGGTPDEISLYKSTAGSTVILINGTDGVTNNSNTVLKVKVTRDGSNNWSLLRDITGTGNTYVSEGTANDATFTTASFFGIKITQSTSSFFSKHFFDDIYVGPIIADTAPPILNSVTVGSSTEIDLLFNESIDAVSAQTVSNYIVDNGIGSPTKAILQPDGKIVKLIFNNTFSNGVQNLLSLSNVKDQAGNTIVSTSNYFIFFIPVTEKPFDIIVSEIFADPDPIIGLPAAEFIEIYNRSTSPFDLNGWKLTDGTSTATFASQIILPSSYWVITSSSNTSLFSVYQNVLGVSSFPSLNNSGDLVLLKSSSGLTVDSVNYSTSWYRDPDKQQGGWSLERIDINKPSIDASNWVASQDAAGGTPGNQNSWYSKNPDVTPPKLVSLTVKNDSQLELVFDEQLNVNSIINSNFSVDNSIGIPSSAKLLGDQKTVQLTFNKTFQNGISNHLSISNVTDVVGNSIISITSGFYYIITVEPNRYDIIISEILPDPDPVIGLPVAEFIEIYNRSKNPFDLSGWKLTDGASTATFASQIILPNSYWVITSSSNSSLFSAYQNVIGVSNFPSLNNAGDLALLKSSSGLTIDSLNYSTSWYRDADKQQGGWSLERIDLNKSSTDASNWVASQNATGGTPGNQNSWYGKNPDVTPPKLVSLTVKSDSQLELVFDEPLDENTIIKSNFSADNAIGNPISAQVLGDLKTVQLTFNTLFQNGIENNLTLNAISDLVGNKSATIAQSFTYIIYSVSINKDVIFTEIFVDPTPSLGLPDAEFIEIYNGSETPFNLVNWSFFAGNSKTIFSDQIILPKNYLIVTNSKNISKFSPNDNTIGLPSFPLLPNEGTSLIIKNDSGLTIDSLNYSTSWYRDNDKAEGGYSLELIDPNNPCGEEDNWTASESSIGGTPGKQNSVFANKPDLTGPMFVAIEPLGTNQLLLTFNEKLESNSLKKSNIEIIPRLEISDISFTDVSKRQITITLGGNLAIKTLYTVTLTKIYDCAGNLIQDDFAKLSLALPEEVEAKDLLINEVLFNPKANGVDFVEIYNNSSKYISLSGIKLSNIENGVIKNVEPITVGTPILQPNQYLVFTTDLLVLKNNYPAGVESNFFNTTLPSLPDDSGSIAIVGNSGLVIDSFAYSNSFHSTFIKDDGGVSLERISFRENTNDAINWKSASANSGFATPGYLNSNSRPEQGSLNEKIKIDPEIFEPNSGSQDFAKINYAFDQNNLIANIKVLDLQGRVIKTIVSNQTLGYSGFFRWDGNLDDGTKARMGYYTIWIDLYDDTGVRNTLRKRVIIAGR